jgi:hypothetical protein
MPMDHKIPLGEHHETISARLEEVMAFLRTPAEVSAPSPSDGNDVAKRQLVAALDLVHRAMEIIRLFEERTAESELEAQEFERSTRELMQRTVEEFKIQKARCQELEAHLSEANARAQEAERRASHAGQRAAEAYARALAAETRAADAETRSKQSERWRARLKDALQELSSPLATAPA